MLFTVTNQQLIMEEVLARFPHLGDKILKKLDSKSLINCKEVNRTFKDFMKVEKRSYLSAIQWYTNCSDSLMREIVEKCGAAIIILSILREIFGNFIRGTKQHHKYLQKMEQTPLHFAAERGQSGVYQLIMENIVDKNPFHNCWFSISWKIRRREKWFAPGSATPLHLAAKNGYFSVCKLIIENVLDKNPTASITKNNHTAAQDALYDELMERGILTEDQWTPMHLAANNGHFSVCELIINKISEKNPKDQQGWTPLHSAAQNGHLRVCELILSNIQKCNKVRYGNPQLYNPFDKHGNSPFKLANEKVGTMILKFIFNAKERKVAFDEFKIQFLQELEMQELEIQENNKISKIYDNYQSNLQMMDIYSDYV